MFAFTSEHNSAKFRESKALSLATSCMTSRLIEHMGTFKDRDSQAIRVFGNHRLLRMVYEGSITRELLRLAPKWDPLRENPRFKELLSKVSS